MKRNIVWNIAAVIAILFVSVIAMLLTILGASKAEASVCLEANNGQCEPYITPLADTPTPTLSIPSPTPTPNPCVDGEQFAVADVVIPCATPTPQVTETPRPSETPSTSLEPQGPGQPGPASVPQCNAEGVTQGAANVHVFRNGDQAVVKWIPTAGNKVHIYYKQVSSPEWQYSVTQENTGYATIHGLGSLDITFAVQQVNDCGGGVSVVSTPVVDGASSQWVLFR